MKLRVRIEDFVYRLVYGSGESWGELTIGGDGRHPTSRDQAVMQARMAAHQLSPPDVVMVMRSPGPVFDVDQAEATEVFGGRRGKVDCPGDGADRGPVSHRVPKKL